MYEDKPHGSGDRDWRRGEVWEVWGERPADDGDVGEYISKIS